MIFLEMYDFSTKQCLESFITSDSERRAGIALTGRATTELKSVLLHKGSSKIPK